MVKADAYGHGAPDCARAALEAGATALCVAAPGEGAALRAVFREPRIVVVGPLVPGEEETAREARLEVAIARPDVPPGLRVHVKVDTGMGRYGMTPEEALAVPRENVVGLMSHFATADEPDPAFAREQLARFTALVDRFEGVQAHIANSAAALRFPEARFDAVRWGSRSTASRHSGTTRPGRTRARARLAEPGARSRRSGPAIARATAVASCRACDPDRARPVGYGDGFRRGLTGTEVLVAGRAVACRHDLHGLFRGRAPGRAGGRAGRTDRRGRPRRGARAHARDDQLRGDLRDPTRPERAVRRSSMDERARPRGRRRVVRRRRSGAGRAARPAGARRRRRVRRPRAGRPAHADEAGAALFPLSERHGAWRVAFPDGQTVDFTPMRGTHRDDLAPGLHCERDRAALGRRGIDPLGGRATCAPKSSAPSRTTIFRDDPLRLLRAVRLEEELGFRLDAATESSSAGTRRSSPSRPASGSSTSSDGSRRGFRRLDELGLLDRLGGSLAARRRRRRRRTPTCGRRRPGRGLLPLPVSRRVERNEGPARRRVPEDSTPRAVHRFRRRTEPWALEALAFLGARELGPAVERRARRRPRGAAPARRRARPAARPADRRCWS